MKPGYVKKWLLAPRKVNLTRPSDLGEFPRLCLALWQLDIIDPHEMIGSYWVRERWQSAEKAARAWQKLHARTVEFMEWATQCKHPVMEYILDHGLPRNCGTWLPEGRTVWCPSCGANLNIVPCVNCTSCSLEDKTLVSALGQYERKGILGKRLKAPRKPTQAYPGSAEKIEEMRRRAERGERLFHPKDRPINAPLGSPSPMTNERAGVIVVQ